MTGNKHFHFYNLVKLQTFVSVMPHLYKISGRTNWAVKYCSFEKHFNCSESLA